MNDPYKVLNIPSSASDDEVKRAYRELARKYHPDNYHDNPLADLAQEKMKEINEAYELIQKQRKGSTQGGYYGAQRGTSYTGSTSSNPVMQQVRMAINRGDITAAERLLNSVSTHDAEWFFLMGTIYVRRGWLDDAKRYLETAYSMDPGNPEYQNALARFKSQGYRPTGYSTYTTTSCGNDLCSQWCMAMMCCNLLGGGFYFVPCIC